MASESSQIASVYSQAALELAQQQDQQELVHEELCFLSERVQKTESFGAFLASPAISKQEKGQVLEHIFSGKLSELTLHLLGVLNKRNRLTLIPEIYEEYVGLEDEQARRAQGEVTTAVELSEQERSRVSEQINRAIRKKVTLKTKVDPSVLGGMVLRIGDTILDASVRAGLKQMLEGLYKKRELVIKESQSD